MNTLRELWVFLFGDRITNAKILDGLIFPICAGIGTLGRHYFYGKMSTPLLFVIVVGVAIVTTFLWSTLRRRFYPATREEVFFAKHLRKFPRRRRII